MSLTSYRTAPPRDNGCGQGIGGPKTVRAMGWLGSDLLSRALRRSTIGAAGFHCRVRDGIGCLTRAITAKPTHRPDASLPSSDCCVFAGGARSVCGRGSGAVRAIRTGPLRTLLRFHSRPMDVVVFHDSQARPGFEGSFPLRCFQRLSLPTVATRLCRWRDNRSTRGSSTPVLSY